MKPADLSQSKWVECRGDRPFLLPPSLWLLAPSVECPSQSLLAPITQSSHPIPYGAAHIRISYPTCHHATPPVVQNKNRIPSLLPLHSFTPLEATGSLPPFQPCDSPSRIVDLVGTPQPLSPEYIPPRHRGLHPAASLSEKAPFRRLAPTTTPLTETLVWVCACGLDPVPILRPRN